jgi:Ca2+-binding RTX toxin-like protein
MDIDPPTPVGCVPAHQTLFIPNVTTDVGLSPPFNSMFTIFGQFFDHGLDKITNGGNGTVFVPLKADDPLVAGPDHIFGNSDDLPASLRFMVLTRGKIVAGPDGYRNAPNTDTPFVDQSQTYTSHASHQVFTREYVSVAGRPVATGKFLSSPDGGLPTWTMVKDQAANLLGLKLVDSDVGDIPMVAADAYGNFLPGPNGLPQFVTDVGLVEGNTTTPVPADVPECVGPDDPPGCAPVNDPAVHRANRIATAFLNDIAHSAVPTNSNGSARTPDADTDTGGSLDPVAPGEYDDELLGIHAICGDGRCNENIALQSIHQIFHNEHDRLVADIQGTLDANPSLKTAYEAVDLAAGPNKTFAYGERLFQAARFVTEMEYQHLVFEEFARKVQPAINPFEPFAFNQTNVNPAITAEFAHAVYRFGHSMLTEDIPRLNSPESVGLGAPLHNDIPLLDGFLNPAAYHDGGNDVVLSSADAAGALLMGLADQTGNEIDEFVTETLRNHLLGLPLDLPSINMARARSEGVPPLNSVRRQIFATTNDGQLTPYTNWVDFGQALKHPESLVNFIAAYGRHPTITGNLKARRTAADQIVNGTTLPGPDGVLGTNCATATPPSPCDDDVFPPGDSGDFMFGTGPWANDNGVTVTGVDDIDLWVGGLAENTNLFGGLLGSTFNYVFENQLTNLQNGDRFYYLARTPGMNLRSQLEGNSFSELIMRNTNAHTLKADPFATADCKFELGNLTWPAASGSFLTGPGTVNDDPASDCDENRLLLRQPDGQIRYRATNSVDTPGINGQSVYNGAPGTVVDRIFGGNDNDTFWGGLGNDVIDGGAGDDVVLGGEGNDIITDFGGADVPKGGPGNDAIDGGIGDDIIMGGEGKDFTNGGANVNEHFLGEGDDFAIGGQGADAIFGDSGDDWQEGGDQPDLLIGDSSTLFFDDHNLPGHDILIGQGGDDDYDMEGGDDIGVAGPGVEKNAGASGYDWLIGQEDPQPQNADLSLAIVNAPPANETRDRYNEVEALSGWDLNDTLRGDDVIPSQVGGIGFIGCDALDQDGLDRIAGLDDLVPPLATPIADVLANSVTQYCLLSGDFVWGDGNILLGGRGSDLIEGRGADDIIDGDKYVRVRLSIRQNPDGTGPEIATTTLMESVPTGSGWTGALAGKTLQQAVFAGLVDPGRIVAVREVVSNPAATDVDTALFSGPRANYTVTQVPATLTEPAKVIVTQVGANVVGQRVSDGTDTVTNVEKLQFSDLVVSLGTPVATVSPTALDFGVRSTTAAAFTRPVLVTNTGNGDLTVTGATVTGPDAGLFTVTNGCTTVVPAATCTISVAFTTTTVGAKTAQLNIAHDAAGSPTVVQLTGTGVLNTPATGLPVINDPTPTEGFTVNAATTLIADADGLVGTTFSTRWQVSNVAGTVFTDIAGATSASFTPLQAQVGRRLRVVTTFVDNHGTTEALTSSPTGVVGDLFPGIGDNNAGVDVLAGTAGDDIYSGGLSADTLGTAAGDDLISGDAGDDTINAGAGNDRIRFAGVLEGFDDVGGGAGTDVIEARTPGTDIGLRAVAGVETVTSNGFANVRILGSGAADTLNFSAVTLTGIQTINGGAGADILTGSAAADVILGANGADTINGGPGNDIIEGGNGADTLNGQGGQNQFRYFAGFGADIIAGFDANPTGGQDLIDLRGLGITAGTFAANVTIAAGPVAGSTLVTVVGQGTIQLNGVGPAAVTQTDFILS